MPYEPIWLLALELVLHPGKGEAREYHCDNRWEIVVATDNSADLEGTCTAAGKALEFLGSYAIHSEVINLMSYQAIFAQVNRPEMYGEPFDEDHYSGAIAHEVAQAVRDHNIMSKHVSQAPQVYLAHATQLAVLPASRRSAILMAMDVGPGESGDGFAIKPCLAAALASSRNRIRTASSPPCSMVFYLDKAPAL